MSEKYDRVEVKLYKKKLPVREIEFGQDTAETILEAIRFYWINAERIENDMLKTGSQRLRNSAFNLKKDLQEVMDILYDR